jgi:hypothetical protein
MANVYVRPSLHFFLLPSVGDGREAVDRAEDDDEIVLESPEMEKWLDGEIDESKMVVMDFEGDDPRLLDMDFKDYESNEEAKMTIYGVESPSIDVWNNTELNYRHNFPLWLDDRNVRLWEQSHKRPREWECTGSDSYTRDVEPCPHGCHWCDGGVN